MITTAPLKTQRLIKNLDQKALHNTQTMCYNLLITKRTQILMFLTIF